jgi:hypothetical protein
MTAPRAYLLRMSLFLLVVAAGAAVLMPTLVRAFFVNPLINGMIAGVFLLGVVYIYMQVIKLGPAVEWLEQFRRAGAGQALPVQAPPSLLAPLAPLTAMSERPGRLSLSALSSRTLLDSVGSRLDESRDTARYLIGLLVFLGLLGTFWGLLETVSSVGDAIRALSPAGGDFGRLFEDLKRGLERPLGGMGTAFSSSLFGLTGSLVLGFLDLQASRAQNRFYNELEEWLAGLTKYASGMAAVEGDASVPAYVRALLEQTADSLENLQRTIGRAEESRGQVNQAVLSLSERLAALTDHMRTQQELLVKLAENQIEMRPVLAKLAQSGEGGGLDPVSRGHLRNLEVYVSRLLGELSEGRQHAVSEIRSEIKLLARTIAAIAEEEQRR